MTGDDRINGKGGDPIEGLTLRLQRPRLTEQLAKSDQQMPPPTGRLSRQVKHFPISPEVSIRADEKGSHFLMSITAADRPGLLYSVATILGKHNVQLHSAKIATLGERIEDVFLITGQELSHTATLVKIEQELLTVLQV